MNARQKRTVRLLTVWLLSVPFWVLGGYSRFSVVPASPSVHDSVSLNAVVGVFPTNCPPVVQGDATVHRSLMQNWFSDMIDGPYGYPVAYEVRVTWSLLSPPRDQTCDMLQSEIDGSMELGQLPAGEYTVLY
ncbi:MAG: hypothetical protein GF331_00890, partial [Chitinivibrionales bacterium]|nr:hypothetical protein [Chitinivibrionales bacterium]